MLNWLDRLRGPTPIPVDERDISLKDGTPHWAVRGLVNKGFTAASTLGVDSAHLLWEKRRLASMRAWDPACGEGDIAKSLTHYFREVEASDANFIGFGKHGDFLDYSVSPFGVDFIISRPPEDKVFEFYRKARSFAYEAVALLMPHESTVLFKEPNRSGSYEYRMGCEPIAICRLEEALDTDNEDDASKMVWLLWTGKRYRDRGHDLSETVVNAP